MSTSTHQQRARRQQGVALIMAILIVALATILAVNVATDGYLDQRRSGTVLLVDQAYEAGLGAEALAAEALLVDAQGKTSSTYDGLDEPWAKQVTLPMEDGIGEVTGHLEDLQGRFNLNNLIKSDGTPNKEAETQFRALLTLLQIDPKWAGIAADWIDGDNVASFPDGAEDSVYSSQLPPYLAANMPITRTSELLSMADSSGAHLGLENYRKLEPYVAALPIDSSLNVCTADVLVLDSLAPSFNGNYSTAAGRANAASGRATGCFTTILDVKKSFGQDNDFKTLLQNHPDYLSEKSSYFRANILITIGTTELAMYSVLQRSTGNKVHTILRSFGTP